VPEPNNASGKKELLGSFTKSPLRGEVNKKGEEVKTMSSLIPLAYRGDMTTFQREMDRVFDRFFEGWPFRPSAEGRQWTPSVDVSETAKKVVVKAEVPGMEAKDIDISITGNMLTIRGERKQEKEE
jgi:HSP20 family protein